MTDRDRTWRDDIERRIKALEKGVKDERGTNGPGNHLPRDRPGNGDPPDSGASGRGLPQGPIQTPNPWNGGSFGVDWSNITRHWKYIAAAATDHAPPWLIAGIMTVETQGIHERDGEVIVVVDAHPEDGPSIGVMQVKPKIWQYLVPGADARTIEGNIRLGAAILDWAVQAKGNDWERALREVYFPVPLDTGGSGVSANAYVECVRRLKNELGRAGNVVNGGGGSDPGGGIGNDPGGGGGRALGNLLVAEARKHLGKPYVWATAGPDTFDCSGYIYYCYETVTGTDLDNGYRDSHLQFQWGVTVTPSDTQPGDLLFFDTANGSEVRLGNNASHVGFSAGKNLMIHAANPGAGVIESDTSEPYWSARWVGTRRVA